MEFWKKFIQDSKKTSNVIVSDERVRKETDRISAQMFYLIMGLVVLGFVVLLLDGYPPRTWILPIIAIVSGIGFVVIAKLRKGLFGVKKMDEALIEIERSILSMGYFIMFFQLMIGQLIFMLVEKEFTAVGIIYFIEWIVPGLVYAFRVSKEGLNIHGSRANKNWWERYSKLMIIPTSIVYGLITLPFDLRDWREDGAITSDEIVLHIVGSLVFGILFYLIESLSYKHGEKRADKMVEKVTKGEAKDV